MNRRKVTCSLGTLPWLSVVRARPVAELGVYLGAGCTGTSRLAAYERWLGRKIDIPIDFLARDNWQSMRSSAAWIAACWKKAGFSRVSLAVPLLTEADPSNLSAVSRGDFDSHFASVADSLVRNGMSKSILRLGWEFNGDWYPWRASIGASAWIQAWRHAAAVMRSRPGAAFQMEWTVALGVGVDSAEKAWPGADVVDLIGANIYNQSWRFRGGASNERWREMTIASTGLDWLSRFIAAQSLPLSIPEWGTGDRPEGTGGGDDAAFIERMAQTIDRLQPAYHAYWDYSAPDYDARLSEDKRPRAATAFRKAFGDIQNARNSNESIR